MTARRKVLNWIGASMLTAAFAVVPVGYQPSSAHSENQQKEFEARRDRINKEQEDRREINRIIREKREKREREKRERETIRKIDRSPKKARPAKDREIRCPPRFC